MGMPARRAGHVQGAEAEGGRFRARPDCRPLRLGRDDCRCVRCFPEREWRSIASSTIARKDRTSASTRRPGSSASTGWSGCNAKNASSLIALAECDLGVSPTPWQRSTFPREFQSKIHVAHEGVDTAWIAPNPTAKIELPGGLRLDRRDEVVTFVARGLEPMRGFHIFMRAVPRNPARAPNAQIVVVGAEEASYGNPPPDGGEWKHDCLREALPQLDLSRLHFLERLPDGDLRRADAGFHGPCLFDLSLRAVLVVHRGAFGGLRHRRSDTAPVRDVIENGENGVLTPFHDHRALAAEICNLLADAPRRGAPVARAARPRWRISRRSAPACGARWRSRHRRCGRRRGSGSHRRRRRRRVA